jgi:hypothetical protein
MSSKQLADLKPIFPATPGFVGFVTRHEETHLPERIVELAGGADFIRKELGEERDIKDIVSEATEIYKKETASLLRPDSNEIGLLYMSASLPEKKSLHGA